MAKEAAFGNADRGRLNLVQPDVGATNVRYVRFTMLTQQLAASCATKPNQSGGAFADMSELYGRPAGKPFPDQRSAGGSLASRAPRCSSSVEIRGFCARPASVKAPAANTRAPRGVS